MSAIKLGLIGGTGLGEAILGQNAGRRHEVVTPFGRPSDAILEIEWHGLPLLVLSRHGPGHVYNPSQVPFRANIFALKQLGCTHIIASGAVGSLREEMAPRQLVIPDQIIDKTSRRAGTFFEQSAVHAEMAEPFCPVLRQILIDAAQAEAAGNPEESRPAGQFGGSSASPPQPLVVHERGCYVCMEGPAFSTRAESLMHRLWGGDLIGMTLMPEAKLAREAEISYATVSLVTDYDCWRAMPSAAGAPTGGSSGTHSKLELLQEILGNLKIATENAMRLIKRAVAILADRRESLPDSPAQHALELAIWSDKTRIPAEEVQRLAPLWIKYFG